ncbi:Hypothetical predicted protein [Olea europaea subsp. europaea]|uniref:Uncharacterized protein n=1 Tax=Olea europaea subsp. europaea TaxID=158383 RepID=A0A8S0U632_OLEEU|nr:Hypothetical predicted protein [Olea europaea subsp. europaea]
MKLAAVDNRQKYGLDQFLLGDIHQSQGGITSTVDNLEMDSFYSLQDNVSQFQIARVWQEKNPGFNKLRGASFLVSPKYNLVLRRFFEVDLTSITT